MAVGDQCKQLRVGSVHKSAKGNDSSVRHDMMTIQWIESVMIGRCSLLGLYNILRVTMGEMLLQSLIGGKLE